MPRVYILSPGGTGTKSLAQYYGERLSAGHETWKSLRAIGNLRWDGKLGDAACSLIVKEIVRATPEPHVEASLHFWNVLDLVRKHDPEARFVWVLRKPVDAIMSLYRRGNAMPRGSPEEGARPMRGFHDYYSGAYSQSQETENAIKAWKVRTEAIRGFFSKLEEQKRFCVRFDDMIRDMTPLDDFVRGATGVDFKTGVLPKTNATQDADKFRTFDPVYLKRMEKDHDISRWRD